MTTDFGALPPNCARYRELLDEWRQGGLSDAESAEMVAHLADCPECAEELETHRALGELLRQGKAPAARPLSEGYLRSVNERVRARLAVGEVEGAVDQGAGVGTEAGARILDGPAKRREWGRWLAAAAALVAVAGTSWLAIQTDAFRNSGTDLAYEPRVLKDTVATQAKPASEFAKESAPVAAAALVQPPAEDLGGVQAGSGVSSDLVKSPVSESDISGSRVDKPQDGSDLEKKSVLEARSAGVLQDASPAPPALAQAPAAAAPPTLELAEPRSAVTAEAELKEQDGRSFKIAAAVPAVSPEVRSRRQPAPQEKKASALEGGPLPAQKTEEAQRPASLAQARNSRQLARDSTAPAADEAAVAEAAAPTGGAPLPPAVPAQAAASVQTTGRFEASKQNAQETEAASRFSGWRVDSPASQAAEPTTSPLYIKAEAARSAGRYREALTLYDEVIRAEPGTRSAAQSQLRIGEISLEKLEDIPRASEALQAALSPELSRFLDPATVERARKMLEQLESSGSRK